LVLPTEQLAVMYLGRALVGCIVVFGITLLGTIGYRVYISFSKEKIEVSTANTDSNSIH